MTYLEDRGVEYLIHFTPLYNLPGIKEEGIVPRDKLEATDKDFCALDEKRLDRRKDASCFSLSFPNFLMMYKWRKKLEDEGSDVALLFISINALRRFKCEDVLFYPTNAASSSCQNLNEEALQGKSAVEAMFKEEIVLRGSRTYFRDNSEMPDCMPTDPQAEVQISGVIDWSEINFIVVDGNGRYQQLKHDKIHDYIYRTWKVGYNPNLDVFKVPKFWEEFIKDSEELNGE